LDCWIRENNVPDWAWLVFNLGLLFVLAFDLGVFNRKAHVVSQREALTWSAVWICLAMMFCGGLLWWTGCELAVQFLTACLIEKSLSVGNVFVFAVRFTSLGLPKQNEHQVLFWGVLGALMMRAVVIFAGVALLAKFT